MFDINNNVSASDAENRPPISHQNEFISNCLSLLVDEDVKRKRACAVMTKLIRWDRNLICFFCIVLLYYVDLKNSFIIVTRVHVTSSSSNKDNYIFE